MLQVGLARAVGHHGNQVETHWQVERIAPDVGFGGGDDAEDFLFREGLFRRTELCVPARFHLHHHEGAVFFRHDVQFLVPESPVAVADGISFREQVGGGPVFAFHA